MKQVYVARDIADAELVSAELRGEGIRAVVRADPVPLTRQPFPAVWVDDADEERARAILADRAYPVEE
jgi:hypothetical protein